MTERTPCAAGLATLAGLLGVDHNTHRAEFPVKLVFLSVRLDDDRPSSAMDTAWPDALEASAQPAGQAVSLNRVLPRPIPVPDDPSDPAEIEDAGMILTDAEQAGLDALCAAVTEEIGDQGLWYGASDLKWIIESTLFQAGRLIRAEHSPLTLPGLGSFRRVLIHAPRTGATGYHVEYTPDEMLLEDAL